ncbi:MAG TPA: DoxX family protein [Alphaproteobacteria bacterium]|nr:DoxX family protein [Alphaproteobacteria bacterium]
MSKGQKIAMWIISGLLTALFLFAGLPKLLTPGKMLAEWPYAPWFLTFIGACETLGAIGLLIPRLAALAAAGLSVIMIGAVYTLVTHPPTKGLPIPIVVFILLMLVIFLRRKEGSAPATA